MSFAVSLVGIDSAGGQIVGVLETTLRAAGVPVVVVGASVADHGSGAHNAATMAAGSSLLRVGGVAVVHAGSPATCGHLATGSAFLRVGA